MAKREYHLKNIPEGFQIFEERLEVAGIAYRKAEATRFIRGKNLWLELEREPSNKHDKNAIKVIGCSKGFFGTKRFFLGYVPQQVASAIVEGGFWGKVVPRLLKTYLSDRGFVEVLFQILGPKGQKYEYKQTKAIEGEHYTDYVDKVKCLKQQKKYNEAIDLLLKLVEEIENEAKTAGEGWGVAPWYYEQLAIIYRKQGRYGEEVAILEQYERQPKAPGVGPQKLAERLEKARQLKNRQQA